MLQVKPVTREVIDAWPVAESGLPIRVVNSVAPAHVQTIAQLRSMSDAELLALRSLGKISLGHVRSFLKLCNQIEQGKQAFLNVQEVFSIFLDDAELGVLSARYGFGRKDLGASRNCVTLQEIGNAEHKTRERVRQIQETAMRQLQSRLARICLQPFIDYFVSYLEGLGRVANCVDLAPLQNDSAFAGFNPCSVLLLLGDLRPDRITFYNGFFSILALPAIRQVEDRATGILRAAAGPVALDHIVTDLSPVPEAGNPEQARRIISCVMDHCPHAAATLDSRYFLYSVGTAAFLAEVLQDLERPAHYRAITDAFNDRLKPLSRKGAGFVLEMLNANPQCTRVDRGIYDLKAV